MELGSFVTPYYPDENTPSENAQSLIDRAHLCADAGYDYVEVGDHHVTRGGQFFQNVPTAGRLASVFDHVAMLALLPLYEPLFVAEYLGTLGAYTDRLDLWCAIGGNQDSFDAVGVPIDSRAGRFEESLTVIERLLTEEAVTYDGEHFTLDDVSISPGGDPRICIGGGAKPAVERAGRRGDAWVAHPTEGHDALDGKIGWFEDAGGGTVIARRDALVLEDAEAARARASELLESGYRGWPEDAKFPIVGDAEDVAAELDRLEALGVDEVVVGAMDHQHASETFEEFARGYDRL
jgi:alkanesulfonate monooxygenase SsuD/methylene tetrahydromethanopterin reductase-like flavin-dependent oxidoreductase (luciferase family)